VPSPKQTLEPGGASGSLSVAAVIDVVLPVLNEAEALPWVLERMPSGYQPIVVDNGSVDSSAAIARSRGVQVVEASPQGFGAACHAGLIAATSEVVCFMDCDASFDPTDLPKVTRPVEDDSADLCLGERIPTPGAWPVHARLANRVLALELRRRTGTRLNDLGPMRAARRDGLLGLDLADRRSGYPLEMVVKAAAAGWRITGVAVVMGGRAGRSKVTGTALGTARAIRDMSAVLRDAGVRP